MPPAAPHFLPYQGSKRLLAPRILATVAGRRFDRLLEPFAGSGAVTLAAARRGLADGYVLGDSLAPLVSLWRQVVADPVAVADGYTRLWLEQASDPGHFDGVRARFNAAPEPVALLYLFARCVKNAPRFNQAGHFNQAPDRRRRGVHPGRLRPQLLAAAQLLQGRSRFQAGDYAALLAEATPADLVYLDPPYQGTSLGRDKRYHQGLAAERLVSDLADLVRRRVPFLLSYDGRCGDRRYGPELPTALGLTRLELPAGRSAQATLSGRTEHTVESLYVSPAVRAA